MRKRMENEVLGICHLEPCRGGITSRVEKFIFSLLRKETAQFIFLLWSNGYPQLNCDDLRNGALIKIKIVWIDGQ